MGNSPNLNMPYLLAAQAQKHVTHNEALRVLDAVAQLTVKDRHLSAPPASPSDGDRYIVGPSASGDWLGKASQIAAYQDNAWMFYEPLIGWLAWIEDETALFSWTGTDWQVVSSGGGGSVNPAPLVGVNATADATNKLTVKSDAVLLSHDDVTPGSGDQRTVINKAGAGNIGSLLFQSNSSGRGEAGLTGDNDFHLKVSADGTSFLEGLVIDKDDGKVRFPQGVVYSDQQLPVGQFVFTPGGDGQVSIYRIDVTSGPFPRSATISSVSSDIITLTTAVAGQFFVQIMRDVSYIRIWNMSKSPEEPAWVRYDPAANQLQVTDASDISGWANGETIQVGDPTSVFPVQVAALDISPMMQNVLGVVFPQKGIVVRSFMLGGGLNDDIRLSSNGQSGADVLGAAVQSDLGGISGDGTLTIGCNIPSPISNSNLVLVTENLASTAGIRLFSSMALLA